MSSREPGAVKTDRTDGVAERLTTQIAGLSDSLLRAGVPLEERARLLELAAVAAMQAVTLEAAAAPPLPAEPARVTPIAEAPSLREAAA
jgi:hypothetical protein